MSDEGQKPDEDNHAGTSEFDEPDHKKECDLAVNLKEEEARAMLWLNEILHKITDKDGHPNAEKAKNCVIAITRFLEYANRAHLVFHAQRKVTDRMMDMSKPFPSPSNALPKGLADVIPVAISEAGFQRVVQAVHEIIKEESKEPSRSDPSELN